MNTDDLRALQAPLKEKYRLEPDAALVTLTARGQINEGMTCSVRTGQALVKAGLHPATGGSGAFACSGDMLLEALAACAGVTMSAVATAIGVEIRGGAVSVEGDLDFRGTLGVSKEAPVGFQSIRLTFELDTNATEEQLDTLIRLTERYCVVYQTLRQPTPIRVSRTRMVPEAANATQQSAASRPS
jgi:uncharacterized OsmC-like protein